MERSLVSVVFLWLLTAMLALGASPAWGLDYGDLPEERFPAGGWPDISWQDPGGWTSLDVTDHGVTPGSGDVRSALDSLIDTIDSPTVLYFPAGTYTLDSGGDLVIQKSNVIIRGDGAGQTILELGDGQDALRFEGGGTSNTTAVTSELAAGGTEIEVASTSGLDIGDIVRVEEDAPQWEQSWGQRSNGVVARVSAVDTSASTITINVPIDTGLRLSNNPEVHEYDVVENVGIEKLTLHRTHDNGADTLDLREVHNAFVREIESIDTARRHVRITRAHQVVVARNYLHGARDVGGGGNGYGVALYDLSTYGLVIDNIIESTRHALMTQTGASYNVFAYNFHVDPSREDCFSDPPPDYCDNSGSWFDSEGLARQTDVSVHGHWVRHTLFEGNVVYFIESTDYWGRGGPELTFFRNKTRGQPDPYGYLHEGDGIVLGLDTDRQNVVANVLINDSRLVLDHDDGQLDDLYIEGNVIEGQAHWATLNASSRLPDSLYRDTPPAFWPQDLSWPPFGPHVSGADTNQIPAERRYWEGEPMRPVPTPAPDAGDAGMADSGDDAGMPDVGTDADADADPRQDVREDTDTAVDAAPGDTADATHGRDTSATDADAAAPATRISGEGGCACDATRQGAPVSAGLIVAVLFVLVGRLRLARR